MSNRLKKSDTIQNINSSNNTSASIIKDSSTQNILNSNHTSASNVKDVVKEMTINIKDLPKELKQKLNLPKKPLSEKQILAIQRMKDGLAKYKADQERIKNELGGKEIVVNVDPKPKVRGPSSKKGQEELFKRAYENSQKELQLSSNDNKSIDKSSEAIPPPLKLERHQTEIYNENPPPPPPPAQPYNYMPYYGWPYPPMIPYPIPSIPSIPSIQKESKKAKGKSSKNKKEKNSFYSDSDNETDSSASEAYETDVETRISRLNKINSKLKEINNTRVNKNDKPKYSVF